jgi:hypothetical protein
MNGPVVSCLPRLFFYHATTAPSGQRPPHYRCFKITLRHITVGRTPLDEWSARRRDLYLTTHNTHKRPTTMPPAGFEPTIPASERPQTHALDFAMPRPLSNGKIRRCPFSRRLYGPRVHLTAVERRKVSANTRNRLKSQYFRAHSLFTFPTRLSRVLLVHRACMVLYQLQVFVMYRVTLLVIRTTESSVIGS